MCLYVYGVDSKTVAAPGIYTPTTSCAGYAGAAMTAQPQHLVTITLLRSAKVNLDGDANISTWDSTVDHGANDCTTGVY